MVYGEPEDSLVIEEVAQMEPFISCAAICVPGRVTGGTIVIWQKWCQPKPKDKQMKTWVIDDFTAFVCRVLGEPIVKDPAKQLADLMIKHQNDFVFAKSHLQEAIGGAHQPSLSFYIIEHRSGITYHWAADDVSIQAGRRQLAE